LGVYWGTLQQFEGGFAYAVALQGSSARRVRWAFNKAAAEVDLKLRWAVMPKDARQLVLVDVGAHRVVDLLEDPSADALLEWLGHHPGTQVICRDRDGVSASAARRGAPEALQVVDRFHLVHNLADALERFAVRALASLRKELKMEESVAGALPPPELPPP
jgi:transposase